MLQHDLIAVRGHDVGFQGRETHRDMTPEQRDEHAQKLYKEVIERLKQDDAKREAERLGIKLTAWRRGIESARAASRCGALTRRGTVCQALAMTNGRCLPEVRRALS